VQKAQCGFVKDFSVLSVSIKKKGAGGRRGGGGSKKKPVSRSAVGTLSIGVVRVFGFRWGVWCGWIVDGGNQS
jgi:hypothetical protein